MRGRRRCCNEGLSLCVGDLVNRARSSTRPSARDHWCCHIWGAGAGGAAGISATGAESLTAVAEARASSIRGATALQQQGSVPAASIVAAGIAGAAGHRCMNACGAGAATGVAPRLRMRASARHLRLRGYGYAAFATFAPLHDRVFVHHDSGRPRALPSSLATAGGWLRARFSAIEADRCFAVARYRCGVAGFGFIPHRRPLCLLTVAWFIARFGGDSGFAADRGVRPLLLIAFTTLTTVPAFTALTPSIAIVTTATASIAIVAPVLAVTSRPDGPSFAVSQRRVAVAGAGAGEPTGEALPQ